MNKTIYFILAAHLIILDGCKTTLIRQYGVKDPQIETIESVNKALIRYSPDYAQYLCVFRDSAALVDWFKNKNLPGRSQFYNSDGYRIITQDTSFCSGLETDFAANLETGRGYKIDSLITFEKLKKNLLQVGEKVDLTPSKFAFTCVIFWAKFMGKINNPGFQIAASALQSGPAKKGLVNIIFVNMDILDIWNTSGKMIRTQTHAR
ncbi:MAG: hypothetical protein NTU51_00865 [Bacteroidetes bacterium]|nr:hypothetical protein [Bacteroidota bacterium]